MIISQDNNRFSIDEVKNMKDNIPNSESTGPSMGSETHNKNSISLA